MTVICLALGSRGDVEPMAALAGGINRHGGTARVVALSEYADLVRGLGAEIVPIRGGLTDSLEMTHGLLGRLVVTGSAGQGLILRRWVSRIAGPVADAVVSAVRPGDTVVTGVLSREVATALVEARGCRMVTVVHTAMLPTLHPDSYYLPGYFSGWEPYDRWGVGFGWAVASTLGRPAARETHRRLGLPAPPSRRAAAARADAHPVVLAASPLLVPPAPDWPPTTHQTGHLVAPVANFTPPPLLAELVSREPAPVYVGFGSMAGSSSHTSLAVVREAAHRAGRRVVTPALPGRTPGPVDDLVLSVGDIPHDWLLPRMAAVVHHGGAGTTFAGLRAGVPSAAVPFGVDQPFHAERLHRLGVGPSPFSILRMTGDLLATLLRELVDSPRSDGYRDRATRLGAVCRDEDGVGDTVRLLDRLDLL